MCFKKFGSVKFNDFASVQGNGAQRTEGTLSGERCGADEKAVAYCAFGVYERTLVKRAALITLIFALLFTLSGCGKSDATEGGTAPESTKAASTPVGGEDEPDEIPFPDYVEDETGEGDPETESAESTYISPDRYTYETEDSTELDISFKYPSHWIRSSAASSISYAEAVTGGERAAVMVITRKPAGDIVVSEGVGMDKLTEFSAALKATYTDYKKKNGKRFKVSGKIGFCFTYTATDENGTAIKGYASLVYAKGKKNAFYLFHFHTSADKYENYESIRKTLQKSLKI